MKKGLTLKYDTLEDWPDFFQENSYTPSCQIVAKNGEGKFNTLVLAVASPFMKELLCSVPPQVEVCVILPDIEWTDISQILDSMLESNKGFKIKKSLAKLMGINLDYLEETSVEYESDLQRLNLEQESNGENIEQDKVKSLHPINDVHNYEVINDVHNDKTVNDVYSDERFNSFVPKHNKKRPGEIVYNLQNTQDAKQIKLEANMASNSEVTAGNSWTIKNDISSDFEYLSLASFREPDCDKESPSPPSALSTTSFLSLGSSLSEASYVPSRSPVTKPFILSTGYILNSTSSLNVASSLRSPVSCVSSGSSLMPVFPLNAAKSNEINSKKTMAGDGSSFSQNEEISSNLQVGVDESLELPRPINLEKDKEIELSKVSMVEENELSKPNELLKVYNCKTCKNNNDGKCNHKNKLEAVCEICQKVFSGACCLWKLNRHKLMVHKDKSVIRNVFECIQGCTALFPTLKELENHKKSCRKLKSALVNKKVKIAQVIKLNKKFKCNACRKTFTRKYNLNNHKCK